MYGDVRNDMVFEGQQNKKVVHVQCYLIATIMGVKTRSRSKISEPSQ